MPGITSNSSKNKTLSLEEQAQPKRSRFPFHSQSLFLFVNIRNPSLFVQMHRWIFLVQPPYSLRAGPRSRSCPYYPVVCVELVSRRSILESRFRLPDIRVLVVGSLRSSPAPLSREALVQQREDFRHIELDVLQIQVFLALLLHLEQVVELQVQLQKTPVTALVVQTDDERTG